MASKLESFIKVEDDLKQQTGYFSMKPVIMMAFYNSCL